MTRANAAFDAYLAQFGRSAGAALAIRLHGRACRSVDARRREGRDDRAATPVETVGNLKQQWELVLGPAAIGG